MRRTYCVVVIILSRVAETAVSRSVTRSVYTFLMRMGWAQEQILVTPTIDFAHKEEIALAFRWVISWPFPIDFILGATNQVR